MGTTLGEFHTLVSDALGRSTSLDSVIPKRVELAARWIERNYTFQYMRTVKLLQVSSTATYPHIVSLFSMEIKKIELLRRRFTSESDGSISYSRPLRKVQPEDRESRPFGQPESFYLNGVSSIIFNSVPDEDMDFEAHLVQFTKWGSGSSWTHWLLDQATNLLLTRSLMMMMPRTRDPDLWDYWKSEFDLEIQSHNVAEEELKSSEPVMSIWEPPEDATIDNSLRSA